LSSTAATCSPIASASRRAVEIMKSDALLMMIRLACDPVRRRWLITSIPSKSGMASSSTTQGISGV
jgi:hypothetical protein